MILLLLVLATTGAQYYGSKCDSTSDGSLLCETCADRTDKMRCCLPLCASCAGPRGRFRTSGVRRRECEPPLCDDSPTDQWIGIKCVVDCGPKMPVFSGPRGRYGDAEGLTSDECTAECPTGKYNDKLGARTEDDCRLCPPGCARFFDHENQRLRRYGSTTGLESKACSGACPSGKYSSVFGLTTDLLCVACPAAYRGWQCDEDAVPRKGFFDSTSGAINEEAHAYIGDTDGESDIPQGTSPITFESTYDLPLDNVA